MTAIELANQLNLTIITEGNGAEREIHGIYCCDLLSIVMGRAKADDAWITVMGNINAVHFIIARHADAIFLLSVAWLPTISIWTDKKPIKSGKENKNDACRHKIT